MKSKYIGFVLLLLVWIAPLSTRAQGTGFTYQGRLNANGSPANGTYDFRFRLASDALANNYVGMFLTNGIGVTDGLFTASMDFGPGILTGSNYWLEVDVRTNAAGIYSTLSPLQQLTPTPYAVFAASSSNLLGVLPAGQLSGPIANGNLPVNPSFSGTLTADTFSGNGVNISNVNALTLNGLSSAGLWQLGGNNVNPGQFLGSTNNQAVEIWTGNQRAMRFEPGNNGTGTPNVIGGFSGNYATPGVFGATISGGGSGGRTNSVVGNFDTIGGGFQNTAADNSATVGGGAFNTVSRQYSTVAGGFQNTNTSAFAIIAGGANNLISLAHNSSIGGGAGNIILGSDLSTYATIAGGLLNVESNANQSVIGGGSQNTISGQADESVIGGGLFNRIQTNSAMAVIAGGAYNVISNNSAGATIGGGSNNVVNSIFGTVAGGLGNSAEAPNAAVAGGVNNHSRNWDAIVGGGENNQAVGYDSAVAGGDGNAANGDNSVVSGGVNNIASGLGAFVGGGGADIYSGNAGNVAGGEDAVVAGGYGNVAQGFDSTVPGGLANIAQGGFSFAAGAHAQALHQGSFVWADSQSAAFSSTANDEFSIRARNGVNISTDKGIHLNNADRPIIVRDWDVFATNAPSYKAGIGRWGLFMEPTILTIGIPSNDISPRFFQIAKYATNGAYSTLVLVDQAGNLYATNNVFAKGVQLTSDRNAKEHFTPLNPQTVLAKVTDLPVTEWNYKSDSADTKHIGPVAQDFHAAFGLNGSDDKHISAVDESGVALAAIQGLNQKVDALTAENAELKQRLAALEKLIGSGAGTGVPAVRPDQGSVVP